MSVITCTNCGAKYDGSQFPAGKQFACVKCDAVVYAAPAEIEQQSLGSPGQYTDYGTTSQHAPQNWQMPQQAFPIPSMPVSFDQAEHGGRKRSGFFMVMMNILTMGIYSYYWTYRMHKELPKRDMGDLSAKVVKWNALAPAMFFAPVVYAGLACVVVFYVGLFSTAMSQAERSRAHHEYVSSHEDTGDYDAYGYDSDFDPEADLGGGGPADPSYENTGEASGVIDYSGEQPEWDSWEDEWDAQEQNRELKGPFGNEKTWFVFFGVGMGAMIIGGIGSLYAFVWYIIALFKIRSRAEAYFRHHQIRQEVASMPLLIVGIAGLAIPYLGPLVSFVCTTIWMIHFQRNAETIAAYEKHRDRIQ